jgi:hypothetical protein
MAKTFITDAQIEEEIARLSKSPYVKLARQQERIKFQRRQYLCGLRDLEKKGKALYEQGITNDNIEEMVIGILENEYEE